MHVAARLAHRLDADVKAHQMDAIPPQRQSEVRQRKKIIVCESCGRILVDDDLVASVQEAS